MPAVQTARQRARAELTREITDEARRQLAAHGAAALSLRAVARELGMASSALYRYFASRDELLTALIVDAYDDLGARAEAAAARAGPSPAARWRSVCTTVRSWARDHPQEYALVYGSPVPGYRAPPRTVAPAGRVVLVLASLLADAAAAGSLRPPAGPPLGAAARAEGERLAALALPGVAPEAAVRAVMAWTGLFGLVSFELFGHLVGGVEDTDAFFEQAVAEWATILGLPPG